jgi:O-antigen/teichoic acid export membrane protein
MRFSGMQRVIGALRRLDSREVVRASPGSLALPEESDALSTFIPRLRRGVAWTIAGTLLNQGSTLALSVALANILGPRMFGAYAIVLTTTQTLAAVAQLATGLMATKYVAEFRTTNPERAGRVLGLMSTVSLATSALVSLALVVCAPWVASQVLHAPETAEPLRLASVVVLFTVLNGWQLGALAGLESYSAIAWGGGLGGICYLLSGLVGAWAHGLTGALAGMAVGSSLRWMILGRLMKRELTVQRIVIHRSGMWRESALLFGFAVPAAIAGMVTGPAIWLSSAVLIRQPDGHHQMALYAAANTVRVLLLCLPQLVNSVTTSLLSNARGTIDNQNYWRVLRLNVGVTVGCVALGCLAIVVAGPRALMVFGSTFDAAYPVLLVLLAAVVIETLVIALYQVPLSEGRMWASLFRVSIPRDVLITSLVFVLAPRFGAVGLALAYTAGWTLALAMVLTMIRPVRRPSMTTQPTDAVLNGS